MNISKGGKNKMHFRHYFHPAGHGTFFSGHIRDGKRREVFTWVYDCGSKRPSHARGLVENFVAQLGYRKQIDLLCISHFDSDHVCGLELLLQRVKVGTLVLPYLTIGARLHFAAELREEAEFAASSVAVLTLDPIGYLQRQGLMDNIEHVVFVHGSGTDESSPGEPANETRFQDREPGSSDAAQLAGRGRGRGEHLQMEVPSFALGRDDPEYGMLRSTADTRLGLASHRKSWTVAGTYEFTFYNASVQSGITPHSGAPLGQVASDIEDIIQQYELKSLGVPKPGWLAALKNCYIRHFGASARRRNDISLCVFGQPLVSGPFKSCALFRKVLLHQGEALRVKGNQKTGVLLTGDICLNRQELRALQTHLGSTRWDQLRVMQIPHHGSRHNWEPGNSRSCTHEYSVICAAGTKHHPHKDVLRDLTTRSPVLATYEVAQHFDFHD